MDAMGAADRRRHLVFERALLEGSQEAVHIGDQQVGGAGELHIEAGVEHIGRGHALVHVAGFRPDDLRQMGEKRDDIVLDLALDRIDAIDVEGGIPALGPDRLRGLLRHHAEFRQRIGCMGLDLEPDAEPRLRVPDRGHLGAGVTGDHATLPYRGDSRFADATLWVKSCPFGRASC